MFLELNSICYLLVDISSNLIHKTVIVERNVKNIPCGDWRDDMGGGGGCLR